MEHSGGCGASGAGDGGGGQGKSSGAQERSAQLAGGTQSGRLCRPGLAEEGMCLRLSGAGTSLVPGAVFLAHRNGEKEMSGLQCLGFSVFFQETTVLIQKKIKFAEDYKSSGPNSL